MAITSSAVGATESYTLSIAWGGVRPAVRDAAWRGHLSKPAYGLDRVGGVDLKAVAQRLPRLQRVEQRELRGARLDEVGEATQDLRRRDAVRAACSACVQSTAAAKSPHGAPQARACSTRRSRRRDARQRRPCRCPPCRPRRWWPAKHAFSCVQRSRHARSVDFSAARPPACCPSPG